MNDIEWPDASETTNPFSSHPFLSTLEQTGVCSAKTGWQPEHIVLNQAITIPCYLKSHSWGEYVFDWSWANAYEQAGLNYYPKLLVAIPYTPSVGPRFIGVETKEDMAHCIDALIQKTRETNASGFHILFPNQSEQALLNEQANLLRRTDVQFHWKNKGYSSFDEFLDAFSSRKRKNVNKERASISQQGIQMRRISGHEITTAQMDQFYQFYHATYLKRGRQGYLNRAFFDQILKNMKDNLMLVMAHVDNQAIAAALFFHDESTLYGRYWGCFDEFKNLHFEACYYQGIEFCIENNLERFDPGTQGEHKIARGFEPVYTHSYHWLRHPQFNEAVKHFCRQELEMTQQYFKETSDALPFKTPSPS